MWNLEKHQVSWLKGGEGQNINQQVLCDSVNGKYVPILHAPFQGRDAGLYSTDFCWF